jgi:hypothetical protein
VDGATTCSLTELTEKAGAAITPHQSARSARPVKQQISLRREQVAAAHPYDRRETMTFPTGGSHPEILGTFSTAVAGQAGPSSSAGSMKVERHTSKSRRMSPGGSRHTNEDATDEGRNGFSRSASDSGSDWLHVQKTRVPTVSDAGVGAQDTEYDLPNGRERSDRRLQLDLAHFPPQELLRILASLLTQIATTNDQLRPTSSTENDTTSRDDKERRSAARNADPELALASSSSSHRGSSLDTADQNGQDWLGDVEQLRAGRSKPTTAAMGALHVPSSTLCFRARNIPSISIEAYLLRILRYCPASCEVFVSILVYFDRMSKMGQAHECGLRSRRSRKNNVAGSGSESEAMSRSSSDLGSSLRDDLGNPLRDAGGNADDSVEAFIGMRGFAIDSFNVHRLVIAGVTVASKFFSDVFYTNSRYAKVGGLPVHELNQLELQFLLLNDFNLMISLEEMQKYADQLLVYGSPRPTDPEKTAQATAQRPDENLHGTNAHRSSDTRQLLVEKGNSAMHDPLAKKHDLHGDTPMASA